MSLLKNSTAALAKAGTIVWNSFVDLHAFLRPPPTLSEQRDEQKKDRFSKLHTAVIYAPLWRPLRGLVIGNVEGSGRWPPGTLAVLCVESASALVQPPALLQRLLCNCFGLSETHAPPKAKPVSRATTLLSWKFVSPTARIAPVVFSLTVGRSCFQSTCKG